MTKQDATKSKLQARLERPPENWVDAVVISVVKDPYFFGGAVVVAFSLLALVALWATKVLLNSIEKDERDAKRKQKDKKKTRTPLESEQGGDGGDGKKNQ